MFPPVNWKYSSSESSRVKLNQPEHTPQLIMKHNMIQINTDDESFLKFEFFLPLWLHRYHWANLCLS